MSYKSSSWGLNEKLHLAVMTLDRLQNFSLLNMPLFSLLQITTIIATSYAEFCVALLNVSCEVLLLSPAQIRGICSTESWNNFFQVTKEISGKAGKKTQTSRIPWVSHYISRVRSYHLSPGTTTHLLVWSFEELEALNFHCWAWSEQHPWKDNYPHKSEDWKKRAHQLTRPVLWHVTFSLNDSY